MLLRTSFLLVTLATLTWGADQRHVDGDRIELAPGITATPFTIGIDGGELIASEPATLTGPLLLEAKPQANLIASIVATSLREVKQDDWRPKQRIAGTRRDIQIDRPTTAFGTTDERAKWGIAGTDDDWENFSVQWDGWLRVLNDGTDLATSSDDGSRVWVDLNGDGKVGKNEWGDNAWGGGQGVTQRTVHKNLKAGLYRLRVQYEDGGGGNAIQLLWNDTQHGVPVAAGWRVVPAEGFSPAAQFHISGPVTLAGPISGDGTLILHDGVRLAVVPTVPISISGTVTLAADLDLHGAVVGMTKGATLALAGHTVHLGQVLGQGIIELAGGTATIDPGTSELALHGTGTVTTSGTVNVTDLAPSVTIAAGTVRAPNRCVTHQTLSAPLTTVIPLSEAAAGPVTITAQITVSADAPASLGVGAWRTDRGGRWYQQVHREPLVAGTQTIHLRLDNDSPLQAEGHGGTWSGATAIDADRVGLFIYADVPSHATIAVDAIVENVPPTTTDNDLTDLRLDGFDGAIAHATTGKRWSLSVRPVPYPAEPFDPALYALDLTIIQPDGRVTTIAGFHDQPVIAHDRGDLETYTPVGAPSFRVRFRPSLPGQHRLRLTATRAGSAPIVLELPTLEVSGQPWDGITKPDVGDPRFFSAGGAFVWPAGCNLNSTYDVRSKGALQTLLTPDRGSLTRGAYLERLAAGGGTGCETWLSPWNLGLEWTPRWPGFKGAGRYHDGHAWALDQFLDRAEQLGVRVNLSLFNHGMARDGGGAEDDWKYHPYFRANGGWLDEPKELFTDARAFSYQSRLFRYLGARYGDSPALLGWKLWAEVNLAHAPRENVQAWHDRAAQALRARDPYHHPVTSHWCGDWNAADRVIGAMPAIGYLTIDAYHGNDTAIAELLNQSTRDPLKPNKGLAVIGKPILVTEFGGSAGACNRERMRAEFAIGPWAGFVSGHAGSPMLWWFEWIDQEDRFGVYGAFNRFAKGEDLRGSEAQCIAPTANSAAATLWCRAWARPGRILGYVVDRTWGMNGGDGTVIADATVKPADDIRAGALQLEWWDPATGAIIAQQELSHPGGALILTAPSFSKHLAWKLWRK